MLTAKDVIAYARNFKPHTYELAILSGLQGKPCYQGTVPAHVKASRRAANKRARVARRATR